VASSSFDSALSESAQQSSPSVFHISPIITITLLSLYVSLTIPLPFLAKATQAPIPPALLVVGIVLGGVALVGALSERVITDDDGIRVTYPAWARLWRRGWSLSWSDVTALKPRSTGQGGLVYYFLNSTGEAFLLPMRVVGFAKLVRQVEVYTGIDTTDVKPLSQPWMYLILFGFTLMLLLVDAWTIVTAVGL
jgi:hypothetical protein